MAPNERGTAAPSHRATTLLLRAAWLQQSVAAHAEAFHVAKAPRKLKFATTLGVVDLDLEIGSSVQSFSVSPVLAALILPFQEHACLTPAELSELTNVPLDVLLRRCVPLSLHAFCLHAALSRCRTVSMPHCVDAAG